MVIQRFLVRGRRGGHARQGQLTSQPSPRGPPTRPSDGAGGVEVAADRFAGYAEAEQVLAELTGAAEPVARQGVQ